mmetsp:Transcript_84569/g.258229  ORF Transcript_84569/g.258229 Transcript_84569/m.258229 type:complete len:273 (+) Transcript_84569:684-1502(+)
MQALGPEALEVAVRQNEPPVPGRRCGHTVRVEVRGLEAQTRRARAPSGNKKSAQLARAWLPALQYCPRGAQGVHHPSGRRRPILLHVWPALRRQRDGNLDGAALSPRREVGQACRRQIHSADQARSGPTRKQHLKSAGRGHGRSELGDGALSERDHALVSSFGVKYTILREIGQHDRPVPPGTNEGGGAHVLGARDGLRAQDLEGLGVDGRVRQISDWALRKQSAMRVIQLSDEQEGVPASKGGKGGEFWTDLPLNLHDAIFRAENHGSPRT